MANCENCTAKDDILSCSYCGSNLCGNCIMSHEPNCAHGYYDNLECQQGLNHDWKPVPGTSSFICYKCGKKSYE